MSHLKRSFSEPKRLNISWDEKWKSYDNGLIACWERGREKALEDPELAARAKSGELVILAWKGGVEKAIKAKHKYGTLNYLATWQDSLEFHTYV